MEAKMRKVRFTCFLLSIFIFAVGCQKEEPQLSPFPSERESEGVVLPTPKERELKEGFGLETTEIINEEGQTKLQLILDTGGFSIPKDLNDKNIKKMIRPDQVVDSHIDSWILFLISDFAFLKKVNLFEIKETFKNFGESVYDQHLAVWISDKKGKPDIKKMRYYCYEKFGLDFNHGPYIVITKIHPDVRKKNDPFFRIKLYAIDAERICWLLNTIAFSINENKITTMDLFVDEKIALLKSHVREILKIQESLLDIIF